MGDKALKDLNFEQKGLYLNKNHFNPGANMFHVEH